MNEGCCEACMYWDYDSYDGTGNCRRASSDSGEPIDEESLMYACDTEAYSAWLVTKPNFGCVMYEPRTDVALPDAVARKVNAVWTWEAGAND